MAWGIVAGLVAGLACVGLGTLFIRSYGIALFLATPFVVGAASAFVAESINPRGVSQALFTVLGTIGVIAGALLLLAVEGLLCMLMAAPLALPLALLGGMVGQSIRRWEAGGPVGAALLVLLVPSGQLIDKAVEQTPSRVVHSAIVVNASPAQVWDHVVKFDDIGTPPAWYFRAGLSYPVRARIEGTGVGAIRWCEFTTGSFREPITAWDAPARLAFDVTEQPAPLTEWSP
ncbi:MAG: SRPBCC family protein [Acidobacteria bacterium]|nr:SRPBCC family protein [Acidobacteriota bacterium]